MLCVSSVVAWPRVQVWALEPEGLGLNPAPLLTAVGTEAQPHCLSLTTQPFFFICETGALILVFWFFARIAWADPFVLLGGVPRT